MAGDEGPPELDEARAELFEAIGHPTRVRILEELSSGPMGFAQLKRSVGLESSGLLTFHLGKLRHLVKTNSTGDYDLTDEGREAVGVIGTIEGTRSASSPEIRVRRKGRNQLRGVIGVLVAVILILGSVAAFQQEQMTILQGQIDMANQEVALYVKNFQPFISGQQASQVLGQPDFNHYGSLAFVTWQTNGGHSGYASQSGLNAPSLTIFDSSGNLWVVDSGADRLLRFNPPFAGGMSASLEIGQKNFTSVADVPTSGSVIGRYDNDQGPTGAAFDSAGNLWVVDGPNNRVLEFKPAFADGMTASLVIGQKNLTGSSPSLAANRSGLCLPTRIAFGPKGEMWVVDSCHNRVLEFAPPFSDGMDASVVIGQDNFTGSLASTSPGGLNLGRGDIVVDASDNLWVGDSLNDRILQFKQPFNNGMQASLVIGLPSSLPAPPTSQVSPQSPLDGVPGTLNLGYAIAFDPAGNLWATFNNRLLEFRPPFGANMQPSLELGQPDFTSTVWVGGTGGLNIPNHPTFDSVGDLWVPDGGNNRVLEFSTPYPTPGASNVAIPIIPLSLTSLAALGVIGGVLVVFTLVLMKRRWVLGR